MLIIEKLSNGIEKQLNGYVQRANAVEGYLNRVVVEQYRNIQRKRWQTQNASEGTSWDPVTIDYGNWKRVAFADYEGAGLKLMIATGNLMRGVIGPGEGFRKVSTPRSLTLSTTVPYAGFANEARTFSTYSTESIQMITRGITSFIVRNQIRDFRGAF